MMNHYSEQLDQTATNKPINKKNDSGSELAFPVSTDICGYNYGLTKRECFAGLAMQGAIASDVNGSIHIADAAIFCVAFADALIKELEVGK